MTVKEMKCIYSALWHTKDTIENFACENYPFTEFADGEMRDMFYKLNDMCITISEKIEKAEAAANN